MLGSEIGGYVRGGVDDGGVVGASSAFSFADAVAALRRQVALVFVFVLFGLAGSGVFMVFFKPDFSATATLLIDTRKYPESPQSEIAARTVYDSSAAIDTQAEILKSQTLIQAVVDKLELWREPEFVKSGGGMRDLFTKYFAKYFLVERSVAPLTDEELRGRAIAHLRQNLIVKRVANTFTIEIAFQSIHADQAARVANATAEAFIDWQRNLHRAALASAGDWLEGRINDLRERSTAGQQSVVEFQAKNDAFETSNISADERRLTELSDQMEAARSQAADAGMKLNQLEQFEKNSEARSSDLEIISLIENMTSDPALTTLRQQYLELNSRYDQLSKILPTNHQVLVDVRAQIQRAHGTLKGELVRVRLMLRNKQDASLEKAAGLRKTIEAAIKDSRNAAAAQAALKQLRQSAETYQSLYDSFQHRYVEALQADRSPAAEATIISAAETPTARNYKKALILIAAFPALGLLFGSGIGFLRERVGRPFWTASEVESALGLPCADVIPELKPRELNTALDAIPSGSGVSPVMRRGVRNASQIGFYAVAKPSSRFAESLRSIRIALRVRRFEANSRAVGVTSTLPNEGKSTIALALAASAASAGVRTVVVDCDFRNPALTNSWLADEKRTGLVSVVLDEVGLDDVIEVDEDTNLHFVPSGISQGYGQAGEVIGSAKLAAVLGELKLRYDLVIVDLPPMSPVNDVASSLNFIDGYLLVVEWGETKVGSVNYALSRMPHVHENVISVVLNKVDVKRLRKFGFYMRDYYSNKYVGRYISA